MSLPVFIDWGALLFYSGYKLAIGFTAVNYSPPHSIINVLAQWLAKAWTGSGVVCRTSMAIVTFIVLFVRSLPHSRPAACSYSNSNIWRLYFHKFSKPSPPPSLDVYSVWECVYTATSPFLCIVFGCSWTGSLPLPNSIWRRVMHDSEHGKSYFALSWSFTLLLLAPNVGQGVTSSVE